MAAFEACDDLFRISPSPLALDMVRSMLKQAPVRSSAPTRAQPQRRGAEAVPRVPSRTSPALDVPSMFREPGSPLPARYVPESVQKKSAVGAPQDDSQEQSRIGQLATAGAAGAGGRLPDGGAIQRSFGRYDATAAVRGPRCATGTILKEIRSVVRNCAATDRSLAATRAARDRALH